MPVGVHPAIVPGGPWLPGADPDGSSASVAGGEQAGGFALYLASRGKYEDNFLSTGLPFGSPEEALDCSYGFHPGDLTL